MSAIDRTKAKIALVLDGEGKLLGTVTDGDIRRGILRGIAVTEPVTRVMNTRPMTGGADEKRDVLLQRMRSLRRRQVPLLDDSGRVVSVVTERELSQALPDDDNLVFIFAGGLGTRLRPLTETCPKPMLPVGGKPILEHIIMRLAAAGFRRICLSVNYMGNQIGDYFGNGSRWQVSISYVKETEPLGTAGSLRLLPEEQGNPVIAMNGDVLTEMNFSQLLDFHQESHAEATICTRSYHFPIPFGVVDLDQHEVVGITEKPMVEMLINAGIYCLSPKILGLIRSKSGPIDMPDVVREAVVNRMKTVAFPIHEYWIDIGRLDDFERVQREFDG